MQDIFACGIREYSVGIGIQSPAIGMPPKNEAGIDWMNQHLECGIHSVESRIQYCRGLPYIVPINISQGNQKCKINPVTLKCAKGDEQMKPWHIIEELCQA